MASRHMPAIAAAVLSGVLVAGIGLAAGSDESETATGPASTTTTTAASAEESTTTTATEESTTTTSAEESTTTTAVPDSTTTTARPTSTTRATTATTRPPVTTAAPTTTAPSAAAFEVVAGPSPAVVPGCGGISEVTIRNRGGQIGRFSLHPNQENLVEVTAPQLTLAPGGETTARIQVVDDRNGPTSLSVNVINVTTGQSDGAFALGISDVEERNPDCTTPG